MDNFINWSEVSRSATKKGNRSQITKDYKGKKYKNVIDYIKILESLIVKRIEQFKEDNF